MSRFIRSRQDLGFGGMCVCGVKRWVWCGTRFGLGGPVPSYTGHWDLD